MRGVSLWPFGWICVSVALGCQSPRTSPNAPRPAQAEPTQRADEAPATTPSSPDGVTWERVVADPAAAHAALSDVPYDTCPKSVALNRFTGVRENAPFSCVYDADAPDQPNGWYRVYASHLAPKLTERPDAEERARLEAAGEDAIRAWTREHTTLEARMVVLRVVEGSEAADDPIAALGFDDVLPPETHVFQRGSLWVRPDAKPGEVLIVSHQHTDEGQNVALYVLPRDPLAAKDMLRANWSPLPDGHTPAMLRRSRSRDATRPSIRLSPDGVHVEGKALGDDPLRARVEALHARIRREKELLQQQFRFSLDVDVARSTRAPDALALISELASMEVDESTPRLYVAGREANTSLHPALSSREASEQAMLARDDLAPRREGERLEAWRIEVHPFGIRVGTSDKNGKVSWLPEDPSCAPYAVCRDGEAPRPAELAARDAAGEWDAARDGYAAAFATLSPGKLRGIVHADGTPDRIDLVVLDPNLTWQTALDLRHVLGSALTSSPRGEGPCEQGLETAADLHAAHVCTSAFRTQPELFLDVTFVNAPTP